MRELGLVFGICLVMGGLCLVVLLDPERVMLAGRSLMLWSAAIAVPLEGLYFLGLFLARRRQGAPKGWYWRSFEHHDRLGPRERWLVLGCFVAGGLGMVLATLGVVVVLAAGVTALR